MTAVLTRADVREQIERFAAGTLPPEALAAWAFDQFCDEAEGLVSYEAGFEDIIGGVLDELMWMDSAPFGLDLTAARQLQQRLDDAVASSQKSEDGELLTTDI